MADIKLVSVASMEAFRHVLLVGNTRSGKSTLCNLFLSGTPDTPCETASSGHPMTQVVTSYLLEKVLITDTPGYELDISNTKLMKTLSLVVSRNPVHCILLCLSVRDLTSIAPMIKRLQTRGLIARTIAILTGLPNATNYSWHEFVQLPKGNYHGMNITERPTLLDVFHTGKVAYSLDQGRSLALVEWLKVVIWSDQFQSPITPGILFQAEGEIASLMSNFKRNSLYGLTLDLEKSFCPECRQSTEAADILITGCGHIWHTSCFVTKIEKLVSEESRCLESHPLHCGQRLKINSYILNWGPKADLAHIRTKAYMQRLMAILNNKEYHLDLIDFADYIETGNS